MRLSMMCGARIVLIGLWLSGTICHAEPNTLRTIDVSREGAKIVLRLQLDHALTSAPPGFSTSSPPRVVIDLPETVNATSSVQQPIDLGDVRHLDIVQAGSRTRVVINLRRPILYRTRLIDRALQISLGETDDAATESSAAAAKASKLAAERNAVLDIDFRRGDDGAGRVIVDLAREQSAIDVRRQGQAVVIDLMKSALPELLRRRLDVKDFATPVHEINASVNGDIVRISITASGQ